MFRSNVRLFLGLSLALSTACGARPGVAVHYAGYEDAAAGVAPTDVTSDVAASEIQPRAGADARLATSELRRCVLGQADCDRNETRGVWPDPSVTDPDPTQHAVHDEARNGFREGLDRESLRGFGGR